jgi:hypothetical protein
LQGSSEQLQENKDFFVFFYRILLSAFHLPAPSLAGKPAPWQNKSIYSTKLLQGDNGMVENQTTEWKAKWDDEYLAWICGFANAQGGKLYIGIDDTCFPAL